MVDFSFLSKPTNPLEVAAQVQSIKNAQEQNKLLQQEQQAKALGLQEIRAQQELNRLIAQNTENGVTNQAGVMNDVRNNPLAAIAAEQGLKAQKEYGGVTSFLGPEGEPQFAPTQQYQQEIRDQSAPQDEIDKAHDSLNAFTTSIYDLANNPEAGLKEYTSSITEHLKNGHISREGANTLMKGLIGIQGQNGQPATHDDYARASIPLLEQALAAQEELTKKHGPKGGLQGVQIGPAPLEYMGQEGALKSDVSTFGKVAEGMSALPEMRLNIEQAADALENTMTGPGTEYRTKLANAVTALVGPDVSDKIPGFDVNNEKSYDKLGKYLAGLVIQNNTRLGLETDEKFRQLERSSPNLATNKEAAQEILSYMRGQIKAAEILNKEMQGKGFYTNNRGFNDFYSKFNNNLDMRALGDSPDVISERIETLKGADRSKYINTLKLGVKHNLLEPNNE